MWWGAVPSTPIRYTILGVCAGISGQFPHWHNSCCKESPPYRMLVVLSQYHQSCLSRFERRGSIRGECC